MKIHVVIPAYKVDRHILNVINRIGTEVERVWVVDDGCPKGSGQLVSSSCKDPRVKVIFHKNNEGVGAATITGYKAAASEEADVIVKVDGDGQMHPEDIKILIKPILQGRADYTKGNRFDSVRDLRAMPPVRIFGNAALSLLSKLSSGYWSVNDPTNGFTAIHRQALTRVETEKLDKRYFFESDILFRLYLISAVVSDVTLPARYADEKSNLRVSKSLLEFPWKHLKNHLKRIAYRYYLREWSIGSVNLASGLFLTSAGIIFGVSSFLSALENQTFTTAGQATFASLAIILGVQLVLSFISYDIQTEPRVPLQSS